MSGHYDELIGLKEALLPAPSLHPGAWPASVFSTPPPSCSSSPSQKCSLAGLKSISNVHPSTLCCAKNR